MMPLPTLYKQSSTGKITKWNIYVNNTTITTEWGYIDGQLQRKIEVIKSGKNIGKSNETTPEEQAALEAESKWKKQLDKGYVEQFSHGGQTITVGSLTNSKKYLPMLAKSFEDHGHKIKWPCYVQPKLDGIRCVATPNELRSRRSKVFTSLPHIADAVKELGMKNTCLDGELYVHGKEFQKLASAIKRDKPSDQSHLIEYHVYDCFNDVKSTFESRFNHLKSLGLNLPIVLVETVKVRDQQDATEYYLHCVKRGYEGIMLRNADGIYECDRRSENLQKLKEFKTEEFKIVGAEENKGLPGQCSLICEMPDGTQFNVKPEGNEDIRKQYWTDYLAGKLTGKMLTVRFFEYTTSDKPVPRFPIGVAIREEWE